MTPGEHAVRIVRPGYGISRRASGGPTGSRVTVAWDRPATERPAAAELEQLRETFRASCEQLEEYQKWDAEKDEEKKQELLKYLLAKMELESAQLSGEISAAVGGQRRINSAGIGRQRFRAGPQNADVAPWVRPFSRKPNDRNGTADLARP